MESELPSENLRLMNQDIVKLDRFDGQNYTRWVERVKFLLMFLKLYYILDPDLPPIPENPIPAAGQQPDQRAISDLEKQRQLRKEAEALCLGHIKNTLSDRLFDLYSPISDPRELWKALEQKYKTHEEGTNKYLVFKYLEFQMVDDKPIMELLGIMCRVDKPSDYTSNVTRHLRVTPVRTYKSNKLDEIPKWRINI
ncbi:hypothetical protein OSB04_001807 [Centaurea solstitialis]|uniref:Uncharacterized protein n=1 Tax=Centaurea solstitialis TaxID=347529 RepID=A0AA38U292_9ASTR|nr:hypothetical protein OSB04_001807 [Centaurea solstitialis]